MSSDDELIELIEEKIGIQENLNIPKEGESRKPLASNIRHTHYYLFQNQSEIASKDIIFHRQNEPFMHQAIKDTMKYFLGITSPRLLGLVNEKRRLKRELSLLEKKKLEADMFQKKELNLGEKLLEEAKQVGLIDEKIKMDSIGDIFELFSTVIKWKSNSKITVNNDQIPILQNRLKAIRKEFKNINDEIASVESFDVTSEDYKKELFEQGQRLISVKILENIKDNHCPLCNSETSNGDEIISSLKKSLYNINKNLAHVDKDKTKISKYTENLKEKRYELREEIISVESKIQSLYDEEIELQKLNSLNAQISRVIGRISLYLESVKTTKPDSKLQTDIDETLRKISEIDIKIDELEDEEKLTEAIDNISEKINNYKTKINIEFEEQEFRFDYKNLTLYFEKEGHKITLNEMGSGANWLASHILVLISFHEFFIENNRPVPRFLILDQPSQVYFPDITKYLNLEGSETELDDEEVNAVKELFVLLEDFMKKNNNNFQIILFEHANIKDDDYQKSIIEPRWDGIKTALIPPSWKETN
jgi:hypothetical protein